ncbi:MAG TPA: hypothetical protein HPP77_03720 [Candidatus Hydrogenedentes bacterium]|nr:hypothetical protein [Candidatus Hydrogenedentota bacterium]HIJ74516.1 hypothetical protein [Candidatus Hydrogenedentota bacterium]
MTKLLKKAFKKAAALPEKAQDTLAEFLLAEIDSETEWAKAFASSQDELAMMAREALAEAEAGETKPLDLSGDF